MKERGRWAAVQRRKVDRAEEKVEVEGEGRGKKIERKGKKRRRSLFSDLAVRRRRDVRRKRTNELVDVVEGERGRKDGVKVFPFRRGPLAVRIQEGRRGQREGRR